MTDKTAMTDPAGTDTMGTGLPEQDRDWALSGQARPVQPGLHFIATPIGAARDITLRALDLLAGADMLAAEDTRTLRHLMTIHGIALGGRPLVAYHDHNAEAARPQILRALAEGRSVAYTSEAGTPLVADPGYQLARAAVEAGQAIFAAPGPSAMLAALTVSGLPSDRFLFAGFPPPAAGARKKWIADLAGVKATLILYESPKRLSRLLTELRDALGETRQAAVCRELTKRFEEVERGTLEALATSYSDRLVRGEVVVVIDRPHDAVADPQDVEAALRHALKTGRLRDVSAQVAAEFGLSRREVYQMGLELDDSG